MTPAWAAVIEWNCSGFAATVSNCSSFAYGFSTPLLPPFASVVRYSYLSAETPYLMGFLRTIGNIVSRCYPTDWRGLILNQPVIRLCLKERQLVEGTLYAFALENPCALQPPRDV
jgi:hypothetical protein